MSDDLAARQAAAEAKAVEEISAKFSGLLTEEELNELVQARKAVHLNGDHDDDAAANGDAGDSPTRQAQAGEEDEERYQPYEPASVTSKPVRDVRSFPTPMERPRAPSFMREEEQAGGYMTEEERAGRNGGVVPGELYSRTQRWLEGKARREAEIRQAREAEESKELTFKPRINPRSARLAKSVDMAAMVTGSPSSRPGSSAAPSLANGAAGNVNGNASGANSTAPPSVASIPPTGLLRLRSPGDAGRQSKEGPRSPESARSNSLSPRQPRSPRTTYAALASQGAPSTDMSSPGSTFDKGAGSPRSPGRNERETYKERYRRVTGLDLVQVERREAAHDRLYQLASLYQQRQELARQAAYLQQEATHTTAVKNLTKAAQRAEPRLYEPVEPSPQRHLPSGMEECTFHPRTNSARGSAVKGGAPPAPRDMEELMDEDLERKALAGSAAEWQEFIARQQKHLQEKANKVAERLAAAKPGAPSMSPGTRKILMRAGLGRPASAAQVMRSSKVQSYQVRLSAEDSGAEVAKRSPGSASPSKKGSAAKGSRPASARTASRTAEVAPSFKPAITKMAQRMAGKSYAEMSDAFRAKEEWLEEQRLMKEAAEMSEATFRPELVSRQSYQSPVQPRTDLSDPDKYMALVEAKRRAREAAAAAAAAEREAKELEGCTFKPRTNKTPDYLLREGSLSVRSSLAGMPPPKKQPAQEPGKPDWK